MPTPEQIAVAEFAKGILTYVEDGNVIELRTCGFVSELIQAVKDGGLDPGGIGEEEKKIVNQEEFNGYRYTDDLGNPLLKCPECGGDLTEEGGITLTLSTGGHVYDLPSRLTENGELEDTDDGAVAKGFHSGTYCGHCHELVYHEEITRRRCWVERQEIP